MTTKMPKTEDDDDEEDNHHHHGRKRRDGGHEHHMDMNNDEEENQCEPHKLLDEWFRAVRNRYGVNQTLPIVQNIDGDSTASIFQLQYGIPSILIEMTEEQVRKLSFLSSKTRLIKEIPFYKY
jgi:hypothetical protein